MHRFWYLLALFLFLIGCGRYFAGPIQPMPKDQQGPNKIVRDDGSVSYIYERLEINLRPLSDEELNRRFAAQSTAGAMSTNPYTYGNWKPMGDDWTPQRFTVFQLKVKNYMYPKMQVDPYKAELTSESGRLYKSLSLLELSEYYRAHAMSQAGNLHVRYQERKDVLKKTLYRSGIMFSGQEDEGYIVFPKLDPDVKRFSVTLKEITLRFDYRDEPIETTELTFHFQRDVYQGYRPPPSLTKIR